MPRGDEEGMRMHESTARLVAVLREQKRSPALDEIIARAEREEFHDYTTESMTPARDLEQALRADFRHALAARVRRGEFDATREEAQAWANSLDGMATLGWVQTPEGRAAFAELVAQYGATIADEVIGDRYKPNEGDA